MRYHWTFVGLYPLGAWELLGINVPNLALVGLYIFTMLKWWLRSICPVNMLYLNQSQSKKYPWKKVSLTQRSPWLISMKPFSTCDSKQLVYPVTSTEFCSQQPDQLQPPFRSCCLEVVAHLSSMGKHQGWQVVSTPFREPWMEPRGMGAMCPCANTCRNTPAPELSLVEILESFLIPIYIYNYVYIYIDTWRVSSKWFAATMISSWCG